MKLKIYTSAQAQKDLPTPKKNDNKTRGGKCLVIAGSEGLWGAAILCADAASRVGAGYVYILNPDKKFPLKNNPDFLWQSTFNFSAFNSVAIGPGFRKPNDLNKHLRKLAKKNQNVVLDAEALDVLAESKIKIPPTWIITPHEGELSRMLNVSSATIRKNRVQFAKLAQKKWGCIVLLKGFKTLVCSKTECFEIQSGNPALAKAGTGDVLSGMIAGFLSQGLDPLNAACLSAYIHGRCADEWIQQNDVLSLRAIDLASLLPKILKKIR